MSYYSVFVAAVPDAKKQDYLDHARSAWKIFQKYGALRTVETWGADVPHGQQTDFYRAVAAQEGESVVVSWVEWPDRAAADEAWGKMQADPDMEQMAQMPFDGKRMIFGGFEPILDERA